MKVFISGNRAIKSLTHKIMEELTDELEKLGATEIIVGDADGVDTLIQMIMNPNATTVYHSQYGPRNHVNNSKTRLVQSHGSGRAFHTCKDLLMAAHSDAHIGIVNSMLPSGTVNNHKTVLSQGKPSTLLYME